MAQLSLKFGNSQILAPEGWTLVSQSTDKIVLRSNRNQEATISLTQFTAEMDVDQFKKVCDLHIKAVQRAMPEGFVQPDAQFIDHGNFGMLFFGDERSCDRFFFGYVSLAGRELVSMFVEGINVDRHMHAGDFQCFVKGLKRDQYTSPRRE